VLGRRKEGRECEKSVQTRGIRRRLERKNRRWACPQPERKHASATSLLDSGFARLWTQRREGAWLGRRSASTTKKVCGPSSHHAALLGHRHERHRADSKRSRRDESEPRIVCPLWLHRLAL